MIDNCKDIYLYINNSTGQLECLPGEVLPPPGYSQILDTVPVSPKKNYKPLLLLAIGALLLMSKK